MDGGGGVVLVGNDNQGVDLEIGELAVDVYRIKAGDCVRVWLALARERDQSWHGQQSTMHVTPGPAVARDLLSE